MEIVINKCYGGFSISTKAVEILSKMKNDNTISEYSFNSFKMRTDKDLISVIRQLGEEVNGYCSELKIIEIPDDVDWYIEEYDGLEWVSEKHRRWL